MKDREFDATDLATLLFIIDINKLKTKLFIALQNEKLDNHPKLREYFSITADAHNEIMDKIEECIEGDSVLVDRNSDEIQLILKLLENAATKADSIKTFLDGKESMNKLLSRFKAEDCKLIFGENFKFAKELKNYKIQQEVLYNQLADTNSTFISDMMIAEPEKLKEIFKKYDKPSSLER